MAFQGRSSGRSFPDEQDIDVYPGKEVTSTGGRTVGTQGSQTKVGRFIEGVRRSPHARRVGEAAAAAAADRIVDKIKGGSKGGKPNGRGRRNYRSNGRNGGRTGDSDNGNSGYNSDNSVSGGGGGSVTAGSHKKTSVDRVQWNSGIDAGLTVNSRLTSNETSPLYLSSGFLFIKTDKDLVEAKFISEFEIQLQGVFFPLYINIISNRINRYAGEYIKYSDFYEYVFTMVEALQIYYCIDNVLAYSSNNAPDNVNYGMEALKDAISSQAISEFTLLRETLENQAFPPNLLEYIRFLCQSYRLSDAPHASIIKLNIGGLFDTYWEDSGQHIINVIKSIRLDIIGTSRMNSFMCRAFPGWIISDMPVSAHSAVYDKNFMTFWHNHNTCYLSSNSSKSVTYCHQVKDIDSYLDYQILERDNEVDGAIFCSQSVFIKENDKADSKTIKSFWGVWMPLADIIGKSIPSGNCREIYSLKFINNRGFVESIKNPVMLGNTGVHWVCQYSGSTGNYSGNSLEFGAAGFVKLQINSARMQNEALNGTVRLWFNPVDDSFVDKYSRY